MTRVAIPDALAENRDVVGHMIEAFKLRGRATALGYTRGPSEDGGWFYRYVKVFPSLGIQVLMSFSGDDERGDLTLGEIPPVLLSEVLADAQDVAQTGTGFDPQWESKVQ